MHVFALPGGLTLSFCLGADTLGRGFCDWRTAASPRLGTGGEITLPGRMACAGEDRACSLSSGVMGWAALSCFTLFS